MNTLDIRNVSKRFAGSKTYAVRDFSLEVRPGEVVALLGESGCGKTTILRMVAGFETPSSGSIFLGGKEVAGNSVFVEPARRGVGIVFQGHALFPHMTVWQNICFGLFRLPASLRAGRAASVLDLTRLEGLEKRYPHQLSGGQQQRVALARALAPEPSIILFDEPFSQVDTMRRRQMRNDIKDILNNAGITALLVTHDIQDVMHMADRVAVIRDGIVQQTGTPAQLGSSPRNDYVDAYFARE